jgi:hypothetical protein
MQSATDLYKAIFESQPERAMKEAWEVWTIDSIAKLEAWKAEILLAASATIGCGHGCVDCTCVPRLKTKVLALLLK